jgi:hypothetical protein
MIGTPVILSSPHSYFTLRQSDYSNDKSGLPASTKSAGFLRGNLLKTLRKQGNSPSANSKSPSKNGLDRKLLNQGRVDISKCFDNINKFEPYNNNSMVYIREPHKIEFIDLGKKGDASSQYSPEDLDDKQLMHNISKESMVTVSSYELLKTYQRLSTNERTDTESISLSREGSESFFGNSRIQNYPSNFPQSTKYNTIHTSTARSSTHGLPGYFLNIQKIGALSQNKSHVRKVRANHSISSSTPGTSRNKSREDKPLYKASNTPSTAMFKTGTSTTESAKRRDTFDEKQSILTIEDYMPSKRNTTNIPSPEKTIITHNNYKQVRNQKLFQSPGKPSVMSKLPKLLFLDQTPAKMKKLKFKPTT